MVVRLVVFLRRLGKRVCCWGFGEALGGWIHVVFFVVTSSWRVFAVISSLPQHNDVRRKQHTNERPHSKYQSQERKEDRLTIVLPTKSQAKYCAFLSFAGVMYVCWLLRCIASCSPRALMRANSELTRRVHLGLTLGSAGRGARAR